MDETERRARTFVQRFLTFNAKMLSRQSNERFYEAHMETEDIEALVALAYEGDKKALAVLRVHLRALRQQALNEGRPIVELPAALYGLMFKVFVDGEPRAVPGPKPTRTGQRDTTIALMVRWVHEGFGLPLYGSVAGRSDPQASISALQLVGEEVGLDPRTVERIWREPQEMLNRSARGPGKL